MGNRLVALIENHRLICKEVYNELNDLDKIDKTKFSETDKKDIELSIEALKSELSLRNAFLSDLESLL